MDAHLPNKPSSNTSAIEILLWQFRDLCSTHSILNPFGWLFNLGSVSGSQALVCRIQNRIMQVSPEWVQRFGGQLAQTLNSEHSDPPGPAKAAAASAAKECSCIFLQGKLRFKRLGLQGYAS